MAIRGVRGRPARRVLSFFALIALVAIPVALRLDSAQANVSPSTFEGNDGDLAVTTTGNLDWANVANLVVMTDDTRGTPDDTINPNSGPANENASTVAVVADSYPAQKTDLTRMLMAHERVGTHDFLYLGWERTANPQGDTDIDFELNQAANTAPAIGNSWTIPRTAGDVLITYELSNGGTVPTISKRVWSGSAWGSMVTLASNEAEGSVNQVSVIDPVGPGAPRSLDPFTFGELSIDLDSAGAFSQSSCTSFASVFAKTRSSQQFNSTLQDFVAPHTTSISNCGSITINKDAGGNTTRSFPYSTTSPGASTTPLPGTFNLVGGGTTTYGSLKPGTYTVSEGTTTAWNLDHITCTGTGASSSGATASFVVSPGSNQICTFVNAHVPPAITVTKTPSPSSMPEPGGPVTFTVVVHNSSAQSVTITSLSDSPYGNLLSGGPTSTCTAATIAGGADYTCTFTVNVTGQPGNYSDTVTANVVDADSATASNTAHATVVITDVLPNVAITKTPSATLVHTGTAVTYTYDVTTTSTEGLAPVTVTDNKCSPVAFVSGDTNNDGKLDASETWIYSCTSTLAATTTNTATASASDDDGNTATATASATVQTINPGLTIDKVPSVQSISPGDPVTYTYTVAPVDGPISNVTVTDNKCSPVTYVSGDTNGNGTLDNGEKWIYTCTRNVDGSSSTNTATASGVDVLGGPVTAQATASVAVVLPAVITRPSTNPTVAPAPAATSPAVVEAEVTAAPAVVEPQLPRTGANVIGWTELGGAFCLFGLSLLFVARRRRLHS